MCRPHLGRWIVQIWEFAGFLLSIHFIPLSVTTSQRTGERPPPTAAAAVSLSAFEHPTSDPLNIRCKRLSHG